jgi:small subunit ribosomal protein S1
MTDPVDPNEPVSGASPSQDATQAEAGEREPASADAEAAVAESSEHASHEHASLQQASDAESAAAEGDASPEADGAAEGEGDDEGGEAGEGADAAGGEGEPGKKKRRRRRRKKKKGGAEGETTDVGTPAPIEAAKPRKDPSQLPFQKLFEGTSRRHAFSIGEIVAGRVKETREDVAVIDLFGKALAYARLCEPRDVPVSVEPQEPDEDEAEAGEGEPIAEAVSSETPIGTEAVSGETPIEAEAVSGETPIDAPSAEAPAEHRADAGPVEGQAAEEQSGEAQASEGQATEGHADSDAPDGAPIAEPGYRLVPENTPPLVAGEIFRGRVGAVAESGHIAIVNEIVDIKATRAILRRARDTRDRVVGLVFGFNRGGFDVLIYGMRAFCPVSGMVIEQIDDPESLLGQWAQFHVQTARSGLQGLVVSRRSILEKESRKRAKALLKSLESGQKVRGRVTQVRDFGLFVDIGGGLEGLVHQSELSWERGTKPEDVAKVGDEIEVQILKVHERESKRERHDRVSLSLKSLQPDPWRQQVDQLQEGLPRKGTIVRTAEFGAFVQLAPGVDGLLHISELGKELKHADQAVNEGDEIYIVVERIDRKQRRISLSKLTPEEVELFEKGELVAGDGPTPRLKPGSLIRVRVTQVVSAGLHVQVDNIVGRRGRGFIPNVEMGTSRGTDHRKQWPPGTEIDVKIIGTDRDGGLRCSRKGFIVDEERRAVREYRKEVSKQGLGTFGDILRQKLGIDQEGTR